jgi:glycine oxidase
MHDVVVVGGGVIGLTIARELARDQSVLLLERGATGEGTSWAAAGMLSPQSEADADGPFFQLSMASLRMYRKFVEDVHEESGIDPQFDDDGVLVLASSDKELSTIEARARWQKAAGFRAEILSASDVFKLEPLITADICGALFLENDLQVAPRLLTKALAEACLRRKVEIRCGTAVDKVLTANGKVTGIQAGGETVHAERVIVAGGVWSGEIQGLTPSIPVVPRKGQILSLTMPTRAFRHMIRLGHAYFVPRCDGELVVGATNEDAGFDRSVTSAGMAGLLADALRISSHAGSFPIREMWTGLRPATPDGLPIVGESSIKGLLYATGHYRNGILLAPITAHIIGLLVTNHQPSVSIESYSPQRFLL